MASVYDIAQYIRNHYAVLTKVKLQKLLYYCQAWTLVWEDKPLFDEDFEAWDEGPVVPALYDSMCSETAHVPLDIPHANIGGITEAEKKDIEDILVSYEDMSAETLVALTHSERPWLETWDIWRPKKVIPKSLIKDFYSSLGS